MFNWGPGRIAWAIQCRKKKSVAWLESDSTPEKTAAWLQSDFTTGTRKRPQLGNSLIVPQWIEPDVGKDRISNVRSYSRKGKRANIHRPELPAYMVAAMHVPATPQ